MKAIKLLTALAVALGLAACDVDQPCGADHGDACQAPRIEIADVQCDADGCVGRWADTDSWSLVVSADQVLSLPTVDASTLWECEQDPAVDVCVSVDSAGHIGCFRIMDAWAAPVAPCCAVSDGWIPVGDGVSALAL